jgi:hypothetical protein
MIIWKKIQLKKDKKKIKSIRVNLLNTILESWDRNNLIKTK